jgi:hypothetical protein
VQTPISAGLISGVAASAGLTAAFLLWLNTRKKGRREITVKNLKLAHDFSGEQWLSTFDTKENYLSDNLALFFHYGTVSDMKRALREGLPATTAQGGVVFTLLHPNELTHEVEEIFGSAEACVVVALPRSSMKPILGSSHRSTEWFVPSALLASLCHLERDLSEIPEPARWVEGHLFLRPQCIVCAYELKPAIAPWKISTAGQETVVSGHICHAPAIHNKNQGLKILETCEEFFSSMASVRSTCTLHGLIPLYHFASSAAAPMILQSGLPMTSQKKGTDGWFEYLFDRVI